MRKVLVSALNVAWLASFGVTGCDEKKPVQQAAPEPAAAAVAAPAADLQGKVLERIDAAGYSYLRLETPEGETWAAIPQKAVEVGTQVAIAKPMPMHGFESKALKRKFEKIFFGDLAGGPGAMPPGAAAAGAPAALPPGHPPLVPPTGPAQTKVEKAEGPNAKTIAEVWAERAKLKDSVVVIRGTVVRSTNGVMGKNWLHLRDGSGTEAAKDHDLTVTTAQTAVLGDVVIVEGPVHLDRDFGAGYSYAVIVEDATVKK